MKKVPLNRIVLMLNEGNYPSPGKYKMQTGEITHQALAGRGYWQTWTVAKILKEDKYTGDMVQGRTKRFFTGWCSRRGKPDCRYWYP